MVRRRWWVVGFWTGVLVFSAVLAPKATSTLTSDFGETKSRVALKLMPDRLDVSESSITLVFSSDELQASDLRYVQAVEDTTAPLRDIPEVKCIVTYYNTANSRTTYRFVLLVADIDAAIDMFPEIRERLCPEELKV